MEQAKQVIQVELEGRDQLIYDSTLEKPCRAIACTELDALLLNYKTQYGTDPQKWPLPDGKSHSELLLKKWILLITNKWDPPYQHAEICHCRNISTNRVEQAIISGAHTPQAVTQMTSASSACGTCRPDVEAMINYFFLAK